MFASRFLLHQNWLKGKCDVRTFEGHTQGEHSFKALKFKILFLNILPISLKSMHYSNVSVQTKGWERFFKNVCHEEFYSNFTVPPFWNFLPHHFESQNHRLAENKFYLLSHVAKVLSFIVPK